jgi:G3E family GTPase
MNAADTAAETIPVSLITGFLGSGKTSLLNRLLKHPQAGDCAVIVNEFGEIGLDHELIEMVDDDIVVLNAGCVCCTVREDLAAAMRDLAKRRADGTIPPFRRLVIETTGLADPAPIVHTLISDPSVAHRYRLDGIVTTVDALFGGDQLDAHPEALKQAAIADRLVITKSDLIDEPTLTGIKTRLRALNPSAPIITAVHGNVNPDKLFGAGLFDTRGKSEDVVKWLAAEAFDADHAGHHHHGHRHGGHDHGEAHVPDRNHGNGRHDERIASFCIDIDEPIVWDRFVDWLDMVLSSRGESILRLKGILNVTGEPRPVAVHGIQHLFHPPALLSRWPGEDRRSRLVIITKDLSRQTVADTLRAFLDHQPGGTS